MVAFVSVDNVKKWLRQNSIPELLAELTDRLESDFMRWDEFDLQPRVASHSAYGVIELMPTSDASTYGFKYVNGHPVNTKVGRQTVTAFGVLADVENGYPRFLSEMTFLTALRTAATSALAAKYLARQDSKVMAMIGAGAQAEFQALAFHSVLGIDKFQITDTDPATLDKFVANMMPFGLDISPTTNPNEAVSGADIITTCTADKRNAVVLDKSQVSEGVHINAIGGDCPGKTELDPNIVANASVFVELTPQTRIEGEIQAFGDDFVVVELQEVIRGIALGRQSQDEVTVFDSVGFALEDYSVLNFLETKVLQTDLFDEIDLIAEPTDPKNLFADIESAKES